MPLVNSIIAKHANVEKVNVGEIVIVNVDKVYLQDGNSPTIRRLFKQYGFNSVFNPDAIGVFFDHSVLSPGIQISDRLKEAFEFATQFKLKIFRHGYGISHVVAIEEGWFEPGNIVVATDSHTCTGGAVQSLALGMGASDIAAAMVTGKTWIKVPETVWIETKGKPAAFASAKDVMLFLLSKFKDEIFLYKSVEWCGEWIESLSGDSACTIANMAVEMGAKCAFLPPWLSAPAGMQKIKPEYSFNQKQDQNQIQQQSQQQKQVQNLNHIVLDIQDMPPFIARPHSPYDGVPLDECAGQEIDYIFVGSCANSRISDIAEIANILKGNKIDANIRFIVTPGSKNIYLEAIKQGYVEIILESGGIITPPGCGACVGTQGHIPASGDKILSTMNRNFLGRMGNSNSSIWLSSPVVAAHASLLGCIPRMSDLMK